MTKDNYTAGHLVW